MFGLSQEEISSMKPLDKKAAKKLKFKEEAWGKINKSPDHPKRIQSYTDIVSLLDQTRVSTSKKEQQNPRAIANPSVALEHILHSDHRDADGECLIYLFLIYSDWKLCSSSYCYYYHYYYYFIVLFYLFQFVYSYSVTHLHIYFMLCLYDVM